MTTLREKLLAAIDPEYFRENVSDGVLLDIVLEEMAQTKVTLKEAQAALIKEGMRADRAIKDAHAEIQRVRSDPTYFVAADYFFEAPPYGSTSSPLFVVSIAGGNVRLCRREGRIDYLLPQIPAMEYARRVKDQI